MILIDLESEIQGGMHEWCRWNAVAGKCQAVKRDLRRTRFANEFIPTHSVELNLWELLEPWESLGRLEIAVQRRRHLQRRKVCWQVRIQCQHFCTTPSVMKVIFASLSTKWRWLCNENSFRDQLLIKIQSANCKSWHSFDLLTYNLIVNDGWQPNHEKLLPRLWRRSWIILL